MKRSALVLLGLFCAQIALATAPEYSATHLSRESIKRADKITGSVGAIQAFQAIRDKNVIALVKALHDFPSVVNESLTLVVNGAPVKLRLTHVAVLMKEPYVVGVLKFAGARIAAKDSFGKTAAHYASFGAPDFGTQFKFRPFLDSDIAASLLEVLHEEGLDMDASDNKGRTPLHYAAEVGDAIVIRKLLSFGVAPDEVDIEGFTPKQLAVQAGFWRNIPSLLSHAGADSTISQLNYLIGVKASILSFFTAHPLLSVAPVAASAAYYGGRALFSAPARRAKPLRHFNTGGRNSPQGSPRRGQTGSPRGPALAHPPLRAPSALATSALASSSGDSVPLSSLASSAAQAAGTFATARPPIDPLILQIETLTRSLNIARKKASPTDIQAALDAAEKWLLEKRTLDEAQLKSRGYLLAAIHTIAQDKSGIDQTLREKAETLYANIIAAPT